MLLTTYLVLIRNVRKEIKTSFKKPIKMVCLEKPSQKLQIELVPS